MTKPFLETVPCKISTLTPVHIGCGEDYYPTNYVIDGGFLHCFGEDGLLAGLSLSERQKLADFAFQTDDEGIKKLQAFIYAKKDSLQNYASHVVPVSSALEKFYQSRIGKTAQYESGGKKVNNQLQIARHAFNPYSQTPYFPGSSIKGAIRTAILNYLNQGKALPFVVDENRDVPKGSSDTLQKKLLNYQNITDDPLRLLKVSDANYQHSDNLHGLAIRFAVNRKNKPSKEKSQAEQKGLYQLLECLPAYRNRSLTFDITFLEGKYPLTTKLIAKVCNDFFQPQLKNELSILENLNYANSNWINDLKKLLAGELGEALNKQQAFLLRIGQHGGAESNTLDGVRHIKIMQGKNPPKYLSKPTTIWLAGDHKDQQRDLLPFGWVLIEIDDTELKQTALFLKNQAVSDYQKQQQLQALAEQRVNFLAEEKQRLELKAKQEAEAIEQERLKAEAQAQKAAQLATMSEAQKLIFELQEEFEKSTPQNQPIGGTLNPKLTALINQAVNWSSEEKQALFALGSAINKKLWNDNRKVKERLKALQG